MTTVSPELPDPLQPPVVVHPTRYEGADYPDVRVGGPNPYSGARRFLVFASGVNPHILAATPSEQNVFMGMGALVCGTTVMAITSMTVALNMAFRIPWEYALLPAIVWGAIIFNLDRWFISSQRPAPLQESTSETTSRTQRMRGLLSIRGFMTRHGAFLARLFLAAAFGYIIAEPLVLKIFSDEVQKEVLVIQDERNALALADIGNGPQQQELDANLATIESKRAELDALLDQIAAVELSIPRPNDSDFADPREITLLAALERQQQERTRLNDEITRASEDLAAAQEAVRLEIEVGAPEVGRATGCGPVCRAKQTELATAEAVLERVEAQNAGQIATLTASIETVRTELASINDQSGGNGFDAARQAWRSAVDIREAALQAQYDELQGEVDGLVAANIALEAAILADGQAIVAEDDIGLLIQLTALERVAEESSRANAFRWGVTILLILIEAMPVLGKKLYSMAGSSPYDDITRAVDARASMTADTLERQASRESWLVLESLSDQARLQVHAENTVQRHAIERTVGIHRVMVDQILDDWADANGVPRDTPPMHLDDFEVQPHPRFDDPYVEAPRPGSRRDDSPRRAPGGQQTATATTPDEGQMVEPEDTTSANGSSPSQDDSPDVRPATPDPDAPLNFLKSQVQAHRTHADSFQSAVDDTYVEDVDLRETPVPPHPGNETGNGDIDDTNIEYQ